MGSVTLVKNFKVEKSLPDIPVGKIGVPGVLGVVRYGDMDLQLEETGGNGQVSSTVPPTDNESLTSFLMGQKLEMENESMICLAQARMRTRSPLLKHIEKNMRVLAEQGAVQTGHLPPILPGQDYAIVVFTFDTSFFRTVAELLTDPWMEIRADVKCGYSDPVPFSARLDIKRIVENEKEPKKRKKPYRLGPLLSEFSESGKGGMAMLKISRTDQVSTVTVNSIWLEWSAENCPIYNEGILGAAQGEAVSRLFSQEATKDFTILAENGAELKCHGLILQAHSPVFEAMLNPSHDTKEVQERLVKLEGFGQEVIELFIRFLYSQVKSLGGIPCDLCFSVFQLAHRYQVKWLEGVLMKLVITRHESRFGMNLDALLEFHFFVRNLDPEPYGELKAKILQMTDKFSKDIRSCDRYKQLSQTEKEEWVWELMDFVKSKKRKLDDDPDSE